MLKWTVNDIPSLRNKTAIITGGSSGIGFETARELAKHGARVIIASTHQENGILAIKKISEEFPDADVTFETLDLGSLKSINYFADHMRSTLTSLDILILNAGLAAIPERLETKDHFELTFGVNYLGHYALTANLYPLISRTTDARVIAVSSLAHKYGTINFSDLNSREDYDSDEAYAQSKLAMLTFSQELHRRARLHQEFFRSIAVHPGAASTHIFDEGPALAGKYLNPKAVTERVLLKTLGQSAKKGALPILFAATSSDARSGHYYGPDGYREMWGSYPKDAYIAVQAKNFLAASKLWDESERLSGASFPFPEEGLSFHH